MEYIKYTRLIHTAGREFPVYVTYFHYSRMRNNKEQIRISSCNYEKCLYKHLYVKIFHQQLK